MSSPILDYKPPRSIKPFLLSERFISLIVGPVGSTKTTAGIIKIAYHASKMKPCKDGIRRSRAIWVRNTREQLKDTSIPDFLKWFPDGQWGSFLRTDMKYILRFGDVECEVLFRGLDDSNDVRRVLSLQASFAVLDEFREIHPDIFEALQPRLGRYPDKMMNGAGCVTEELATACYSCLTLIPDMESRPEEFPCPSCGETTSKYQLNKHLWGMSNPPDAGTYWEELLTKPPPNVHVTFQPSGKSPEADWLEFLPIGYYDDISEGKSEEWVDVYVHAKFGRSLLGRPVHQAFSRERHVSKTPLEPLYMPGTGILIGMDAALNPAAVIAQVSPMGQVRVLAEACGNMAMYLFLREKLIPLLTTRFRGLQPLVVIDPSSKSRVSTDAATVPQMIEAAGFKVKLAMTNNLAPRISAVDELLTRTLSDGSPALLIDPSCTMLIDALARNYRYKKKARTKDEVPEPEKTHPWSDLADALQYLSMEVTALPGTRPLLGGGGFAFQSKPRKVEIKPAPVRVF